MKIQFLGGGLANQIRMYVFVRYAERTHPEQEWFYDNSTFYISDIPIEKYQLEKVFGLKLNMLSDYFDGVTWEKIIQRRKEGECTAQILSDMGMPIVLVDDWPSYGSFDGTVIDVRAFDPSVIELPYENVYYYGSWSGKKCFQPFEEENRKELSFPELTDAKNKEYADQINSSMSVGIHVRRGDFVPLGLDVPIEW